MSAFSALPLAEIPAAMAQAVIPAMAATDVAGYQRFLSAMAHYTRLSGDRLRFAAERAPEGPVKDLFAGLAAEEQGHWRLAEADLRAFGLPVSTIAPAGVAAFDGAWRAARSPSWWLGNLYALERVGGHLGAAVPPHLARLGLQRDQVRFIVVHLEVDDDHGARSAEACAAWPDQEGILAGARFAAQFWVGMHLEALADPSP
jgi:hypothetical protein